MLIVDLDEFPSYYKGRAASYPDDPQHPGSTAEIVTPNKTPPFDLEVKVFPVDRYSNQILTNLPQGIRMPTRATAHFELVEAGLQFNVTTDIDTAIGGLLYQQRDDAPSRRMPLPKVKSWSAFKRFVAGEPYRRFIYRGQDAPFRLRTSFHRTGRADIQRYQNEDVIELHRHLSAKTQHFFELEKGDQRGAFLNLAQHHGFPTPLLDWTYSPFVAAFFAFRHITSQQARKRGKKVRIFAFDKETWSRRHPQIAAMAAFGPHLSTIEFVAIDNQRHLPQQSISTVTNVSDIELYLEFMEAVDQQQYLRVIDLPASEREVAMRDLSVMGITAGSMFPGLDGACEEMKERQFPW